MKQSILQHIVYEQVVTKPGLLHACALEDFAGDGKRSVTEFILFAVDLIVIKCYLLLIQ